ncbi:MAG: Eco57I restriction-modification methylase domain-containing protein [Bacteroidales bacterium]|nr:Eco57I restriction-modification methylase domain-containing protein [Bacteroidales bacterium]
MNIEELNAFIEKLSLTRNRDTVFEFAFALIEWMGLQPAEDKRPRLLSPQTQKLKEYLVNVPLTVQPQLYRLTADGQHVRIRFAALKKLKKEYISQLVDNDPGLTSYQASIKGIVNLPGRPAYIPSEPYFIHFITTQDYDKLILVFNQGDQKRIITFRNKLTQTKYYRIVQQWKDIALRSKPELADLLWKSLDVKEVNKEFYRKIKERFDDLVGLIKATDVQSDENHIRQFAIRLIGRYVFCWFLKEKEIVPEELISSSTIEQNRPGYYQNFLLRLFFQTLNTEVQQRNFLIPNHPLDALFLNIPYLDGGLFEDVTEDKPFHKFVTDDWLNGFVKILESYDFTVDESSMQYQQVAIDPEMLGRIFENLLASQNPETEKLANQRKAFGAFYTPREIVEYMVDASLKAYLEQVLMPEDKPSSSQVNEPVITYSGTLFQALESQQTEILLEPQEKYSDAQTRKRIVEKIEKLFLPGCDTNPFDKRETLIIQNALRDIKALDPACGSGAFPISMLLRLMNLREIIGNSLNSPYELKSEILSRNIYGVDIMPMAIEIARLRAWLSLVLEADYKPADRKHNFNIKALPNLDFKFICANSLIDIGYDDLIRKIERSHGATVLVRLDNEIQKLQRLREQYFDTRGDKAQKYTLQHEFHKTKELIKTENSSLGKRWRIESFLGQVDDWNPFNDSHASSFFSPGWMFGIKNGFDVVIGNPPYVQMQKDGGKLAKMLEGLGYETYERTGDVYSIFYEVGFKCLKTEGIHTFITSSQWLRAKYGKSLMKFFLSKDPLRLIELGPGVFENTIVDTIILIVKNSFFGNQLLGTIIEKPEQIEHLNELSFQKMPNISTGDWTLVSPIKGSIYKKIKEKGKRLSEWNIQINRGILTGLNEAFIINEKKRKELIDEESKSEEIIRPILRGRDIDEYYTEWDRDYLISTFPSLKINISEFTAINNYLETFRPKINQTGETFINSSGGKEKSRKKTSNKWYETQDQIGYYQEFKKEKIIWKRIGSQLRFSYFDKEIYSLDSTCISTGEKIKYLTAYLNSNLCHYQLFENSPKTGMGDLIISVQALEPLIVYYPNETEEKKIVEYLDKIIEIKKTHQSDDISYYQRQIDLLIYKFYDLTYNEVKEIDKDFSMSEEEYEKSKTK